MTNEKAKIIIGNIPIKPEVVDDCYDITEYQEAKAMAIEALAQESITWIVGTDNCQVAVRNMPIDKMQKICAIIGEKEQQPNRCDSCIHSEEQDGLNCYECVKGMADNFEAQPTNADCISRAYIEPIVEELENICINGDDHILSLLSNIKNAPPVTPRTNLAETSQDVIDKIKAEILDEAEYAYADFDKYKEDILYAEPDELPDDDFRYGLQRAVEIINKYKIKDELKSEE